jgi:hypothetical protein
MEVVSSCGVRVDVAVGLPAFELAGPVVTVADAEEHEYFSLPLAPYTVAAKHTYRVLAARESTSTPAASEFASTVEDHAPSVLHAVGRDADASRHCTA